jgi:hypothetical protein
VRRASNGTGFALLGCVVTAANLRMTKVRIMLDQMGQTMRMTMGVAIAALTMMLGATGAEAAAVQTHNTRIFVADHNDNPIEGVRVDLLRANGSNTGIRKNTAASGIAGFEVLPAVNVKFKVYYNGATYVTGLVPCGELVPWHLEVASGTVGLALLNSLGNGISGARVDLLRGNGSNTGVRANTNGSGEVEFDALPGSQHKLKVYHGGGSYVTGVATHNQLVQVQTASSHLALSNSTGGGIEGQRVNLLRSNGSNTGVRVNSNTSGIAAFEILPDYVHKFKVYHNGGSYITAPVTYGDDVPVQTQSSVLTFLDDDQGAHEGNRVNLIRDNGSNTGVRVNTDALGQAAFEILPAYVHRFLIYHNGATQKSAARTYGDDITVATVETKLALNNSAGLPIVGQRVNLLRGNGSNTGVKLNTNQSGEAAFQILDDFNHKFRVYHGGATHVTPEASGLSTTNVQTVVSRLTFRNSLEAPLNGARVDLLRENSSNTGVRANTATGIAAFEVFDDFIHKFKVHYNGGTEVSSDDLTGADSDTIDTEYSVVTVTLNGDLSVGVRVDLLRENNSNTGKRSTTDALGQAGFEVLPSFLHHFRARLGSEWVRTLAAVEGGADTDIVHVATKPAVLTKAALGDGPDWTEDYVFGLNQNYPNPFNPSTTIRYTLPAELDVRLIVYNTLGQEVKTLIAARQDAGRHAIAWDGKDAFGREVATGLYIYRLMAGENQTMKKMTFSK